MTMRFSSCCMLVLLVMLLSANNADAHCEIPCGIYGDEMRCDMIEEHIATIEKSMQMIVELSKEADKNYNQLVRWVDNKDEHADRIQEIVAQYFLTQRIKITDTKDEGAYNTYVKQLVLLHQMLVYAMKSKQSVDLANVVQLRALLDKFREMYLVREKEKH